MLYFSGYRQRDFHLSTEGSRRRMTLGDLGARVRLVLSRELEVLREQLDRNRIDVHEGHARFLDPHTVAVDEGGTATRVNADFVLIA